PAPRQPLTGKHSRFITICDALILTKKVANFPRSHANITGRNIGIFTQVPVQLCHEGLAKAHHFGIGAAMRIEIRSTLRTTNGHPSERVFKDLLKTEK